RSPSTFRLSLHDALPICERPAIGFYTTRVVAASNIREAEQLALAAVRREWRRKSFEDVAGRVPTLAVEEIRLLAGRFRLRSGAGDRKSTRLNSSHEWISY